MDENSIDEIPPPLVVCPNCLEENESFQHFCVKCGAPLSPISTVGPLERTLADGFLYRQAVAGRRKPIVVIGIWVMFLPTFIVSLCFFVMFLAGYLKGSLRKMEIGFAVWMLFLAVSSFIILFRTTKNYFIARRKTREKEENKSKTGDAKQE